MSPARHDLPPSVRRSVFRSEWSCGCLGALVSFALLGTQRGHAHVRGAEHQADAHADEVDPFLLLDRQAFGKEPHLEEIHKVQGRNDVQQPAGARLPVVEDALQNLPPRWRATLSRSLSPRPERLTTIR